jgi:vancomycin permeability regulator SanA
MHDVLIVLGYSNNHEDPIFQARVDKAVALFNQGVAPQIIMSGCCSEKLDIKPKVTEAASMRDYAIDKGVPPSVIMLEEDSVDTLGNFYFTKTRILEPCAWHHVGFVSTPWHAHRSTYLAEMVLGPDYEIATYACEEPAGWQEQDKAVSEQYNTDLLEKTRKQLSGISPGDHESIASYLGAPPRG